MERPGHSGHVRWVVMVSWSVSVEAQPPEWQRLVEAVAAVAAHGWECARPSAARNELPHCVKRHANKAWSSTEARGRNADGVRYSEARRAGSVSALRLLYDWDAQSVSGRPILAVRRCTTDDGRRMCYMRCCGNRAASLSLLHEGTLSFRCG